MEKNARTPESRMMGGQREVRLVFSVTYSFFFFLLDKRLFKHYYVPGTVLRAGFTELTV